MDYEEFLARAVAAQSFDDVAALVFDNADLVDDAFFAAVRSLELLAKKAVYESVLRAYGLLEDPEIPGPREWHAIGLVVRDLVPEADRRDSHRLLTLASPDQVGGTYDAAIRLAMVRYAVTDSGGGPPSFLLASAESARALILGGFPERVFDALQYARQAVKIFEALLNEPPGEDRPAIESAYVRLVNECSGMYAALRIEARSAGFEVGLWADLASRLLPGGLPLVS